MTGGLKVAAAVAIGYFLGRHRRFKLAIALGVAGATGKLGGARGNLLEQGLKLVSSSPELEKIVDSVRGELFEAGKAAAKAAASRQVTALSSKLQERAESLQHAANVAAGLEEEVAGAAGEAARTAGGGVTSLRERATGGLRSATSRVPRPRRRPAEREPEEPYEEEAEYEEEGEYEEEPPPRRRPPREHDERPSGRETRGRRADEDEPEDEYEEPEPRGRVVRDRPPERSRPVRRRG
ncbi:hypothetical protein Sme01_30550 [Sphaerisporangium melleum]|uniref:Uncharacterized protein n=1 Tax=Sphaerisporangium melleum TaxID=321316 RepID=A0A917VUN3_9ACTN|nr:hypothetical protein [Sphaerisporangium melleum]GGL16275.1 hypothetical protein GCM10007964_67820 [Sphaerisporangium melleum]GII70579.1 hypothetical protein Sme01_30550 [Sphaerisporangium melleum]